ncbi:LD-carboxypeptidase [Staphylococcus equorum]|uniref:LD-carboxypeptidase n=1 Tax=Staphylococcus equorum TaxID=246432 RepID=A0A9X4L8N0_9STAP|nr:S66 peptidase family protein [Staphylococcus equorum]MDG0842292.1 LD-carboxypeptidase [Staphylococcus equorum]MDG0858574.1 LD-carboxypeptidase [Staphylococcus equorum]
MIKPRKLLRGDTVAIVSLSSGLAGEDSILWRTKQGIERLESVFGLDVKIMPNALKGIEYVREHPELRAADLNEALQDSDIKAIISCIGGEDAIRILPYVDFKAIYDNPKIFSGYSDSTTVHMMFYKMGIVSFYGQALLTDFAENIEMDNYTINDIKKYWFNSSAIGELLPTTYIRPTGLEWKIENKNIARTKIDNQSYEVINGAGIVSGHLIGGNLETFVSLIDTPLFPDIAHFNHALLFLETSEDTPSPLEFSNFFHQLLQIGVLDKVEGIVFGKPFNQIYYEAYKNEILKIIKKSKKPNIPILYNLSFGHNEPKHSVPYGLSAEVNCYTKRFKIKESAVIDF